MPHGASCQYRMLGSDGTVVFPSLCDHDRRDPYDVHGNSATCTDRCNILAHFLSGVFYRLSKGKIICAVIGEIFGTGIIGSMVSYPVMAFLMGRGGLTAFYYTPMFLAATTMGGCVAYIFLKALSKAGLLVKFQAALGSKTYETKNFTTAKAN